MAATTARCSGFGVVLLLSMIAAALSQASLRGERLSQLSGQKTNQPQWPRSSPNRIQTASNRTGLVHAQSNRLTSRSLADVDGKTACSGCSGSSKCVGRTIDDAQCDACSKGQSWYPCNLVKECWCWDTTGPRDPGDELNMDIACSGCGRGGDTEICVSNQNSLIPVGDEECKKCQSGQSFWPCDDRDLCWCWDTTKPKKPPAPASGLKVAAELDPSVKKPCEIFSKTIFDQFAPNSTFPYTYEGLCNAIDDYNTHHTEKFAAMGTEQHIKHELASWLGNVAHESDDFEAGREYLVCGDRKEVDGRVYCKPCNNDLYDWPNNICSVSMVAQNSPFNSYCQPSFEPPEGCVCDTITQVEESGPLQGYIEASSVFYGRGAIQLSWNYNYIRASYSLTGKSDTFCNDPELVAQTPEYAWGTGIYFWMENQKDGSTCHKESLKGDFGGTLNNINGGLECPAYKGGWHADAIKMRLNRYCRAASLLGLQGILDLGGCKGMQESFDECLLDGHCKYCEEFASTPVVVLPESPDSSNAANEGPSPPDTPGDSRPLPSRPLQSEVENTAEPSHSPVMEAVADATSPPTSLSPSEAPDTPQPTSDNPTTSVPSKSPVEEFVSDIPTTPMPSPEPSVNPTTSKPSRSPIITPTEGPSSGTPSYAPTTPQPTMGPCDGEKCPGSLCRSPWGFCGPGEGYCNDKAVWSPQCKENSDQPTNEPTGRTTDSPSLSPAEKATPILDSVFQVTKQPTRQPTAMPAQTPEVQPDEPFLKPAGKPMGGKKPSGGGKGKPASKPGASENPQQQGATTPRPTQQPITPRPSPHPITNTPRPTPEPVTPRPSPDPTQKAWSPTDPEATYFCGTNWEDANALCKFRCPSSKSDDCPLNQSCFAFTGCNEKKQPTLRPTPRPTDQPMARIVATASPTHRKESPQSDRQEPPHQSGVPASMPPSPKPTAKPVAGIELPEGCTGAPCPFGGECRSQYGFCGTSFIYCNSLSTWRLTSCGIMGWSSKGEMIQCDGDTKECPEGEKVHRDPSKDCQYFNCPEAGGVKDTPLSGGGFGVPQSSPARFPELPKPTLQDIVKPGDIPPPTIISFIPGGGGAEIATVDLGKKPTSQKVVIAAKDEGEQNMNETEITVGNNQGASDDWTNTYGGSFEGSRFSVDEWLAQSNSYPYRRYWVAHLLTVAGFMLAI